MKSCFAYIRVSTTKQGERSSSLQEQRSAIEAYAKKHGLAIAAWFIETETAAKQGRLEFGKLMTQLRKGKAAGLIVHKIDRSARNLKDWAQINDLMDLGVEIHFAHESLDLATRGGRLAADIQAVVAADFIRNLRDEVRKGFYGRLKQGYYPLPAPRGYLDQGAAKPKTIDPVMGPLVRSAFELYGTGLYGLETLRQEMWRRGLRSRNGAPLSYESLSQSLRNPFYMGLIRIFRTSELFEGVHEPLVSTQLFDRVQGLMDGRVFARPQRHEFTFRRMLRCAGCGRTLTGERQKGHAYYRCHGRACLGTSHRESDLETISRQVLAGLEWDDGELEDFRDIVNDLIAEERQSEQARRAKVHRDLTALGERLDRLTDLLVDGSIDADAYRDRREALLLQRQQLKELLSDEAESFWTRVREKFELGNSALTGYISAPAPGKRDILQSVGSNLAVRGKEVVFTTDFPFEQLRMWRKSLDGAPSQPHVRNGASVLDAANGAPRQPDVRKGTTAPKVEIVAFVLSLGQHNSKLDNVRSAPRIQ